MALAEAQLAARYNRPDCTVIDHATYVQAGAGDLMEGVTAEAASLAGHLKPGKLTCLYDDNRVTLAAGTAIAFTEDRAKRFGVAQGWHRYVGSAGDVLSVERFGAAAPADVLLPEYGFSVDEVCRRALELKR